MTSAVLHIDGSPDFPPNLPGIGHLDAADWVCNSLAANAGLLPGWDGLSLHYRALLSIIAQDASTRLSAFVGLSGDPILATNFARIANDSGDLFDGSILSPIKYDELGQSIESMEGLTVFTGSTSSGTWSGESCLALNLKDPQSTFTKGNPLATDATWIHDPPSATCDQLFRLYCVSPLITTP